MPVYILAAARTPLGAFGGCLKEVSPSKLAAHALRETLRRGRVAPDQIGEVILGSVHTGLQGGNPALLAARTAGIPADVGAITVSAGFASGLKALALAAQNLHRGCGTFALAGGTESASLAPYLLPEARWGVRFGEADLLDTLLLSSAFLTQEVETLSEQCPLRDDALVAWTEDSRRKAAGSRGHRAQEITPLSVLRRKQTQVIHEDEPPEDSPIPPHQTGIAALADGAACLLLSSDPQVESQTPLARVLDWVEMGADSAGAVKRLLLRTGLTYQQIDYWEIHEASAAHVLAFLKATPEIDPARVNPGGGALALGDPQGASGARLVATLAFTLQSEQLQTGIALIPAIGGPGIAMAISRS